MRAAVALLLLAAAPAQAAPLTVKTGKPIFEQWKEKADAVRIGAFKVSKADGLC